MYGPPPQPLYLVRRLIGATSAATAGAALRGLIAVTGHRNPDGSLYSHYLLIKSSHNFYKNPSTQVNE